MDAFIPIMHSYMRLTVSKHAVKSWVIHVQWPPGAFLIFLGEVDC